MRRRDVAHIEFLDYLSAATRCETHGVPFARALALVSFNEALQFNLEFQSTIPQQFAMPPLTSNNPAEGIVCRPARTNAHVKTKKGTERVIIKRKAKAFLELIEADPSALAASNVGSAAEAVLAREFAAFVNRARIDSAVSKLGRPKAGAAGDAMRTSIVREATQDVFDDALDNASRRARFDRQSTAAQTRLRDGVAALVRQCLVNAK